MKINPLLIHSVWAILIILIVISNKYAELAKKQENKKHQISLNNLNHRADSPSTPSFNTAKAVEDAVQATQTPVIPHITTMNENDPQQKTIADLKKTIGDSELHYIGVYESDAREYSTEESRKRYDECTNQAYFNNNHRDSSSRFARDCWQYAYRAEKNVENTVTVNINSNKDISLVLTSHEPVKWVIKGNAQKLKLIYISGYYTSELSKYFHPPTKVYSSFYKNGMCSYCLNSNLPYFYGYEQNSHVLQKINQYFQIPITSFQGGYKAKNFYIN